MPLKQYKASEYGLYQDQLNHACLDVLKHLQDAGYQAYVVGGFIRDILSGLSPKDFDIATNATPEQVVACIPRSQLIGRRFKLVHAYYGRGRQREVIEIATFRASSEKSRFTEVNQSGQLVRDNTYGSMEDDALRRDLGANALYFDPFADALLDYVDAMSDIEARTLKIIGDPSTRFREDPVRILRLIRFAAKLGWQIEEATEQAMYRDQHLLREASAARLFDEVLKLLLTSYGWQSWQGIERYGVDDILFPHSAALIAHEPWHSLLQQACVSTSARIKQQKSVNPAFIYSIILWPSCLHWFKQFCAEGMPEQAAMQKAITVCIDQQQSSITIPKRFALVIREIWFLQIPLGSAKAKQVERVLDNQRFRAAYDFHEMRVKAGDEELGATQSTYQWWTEIQDADEQQKEKLISQIPSGNKRRRRKPKRKTKPRD